MLDADLVINVPVIKTHAMCGATAAMKNMKGCIAPAEKRRFHKIHLHQAIDGEFRHRMAQKELAESLGIPKENIMMLHTGDVLEIGEESAQVIDHVQSGGVLVDGLGVGDVGNIVLRDRQNLAQNGIIIVVLTLEKYSNQLLSGPDIVSRGFVYVRESEDLMEEAQAIVDHAVADCLERHVSDWGKIKNIIRDSLSDFLWKRIKRNPMILPIIMEV